MEYPHISAMTISMGDSSVLQAKDLLVFWLRDLFNTHCMFQVNAKVSR